jgi:hypothetical protein
MAQQQNCSEISLSPLIHQLIANTFLDYPHGELQSCLAVIVYILDSEVS